MAKCSVCGKKGFFLILDKDGKCSECAKREKESIKQKTNFFSAGKFDKKLEHNAIEEWLPQVDPQYKATKERLAHQEKLLSLVWKAREQYKIDNDINELIKVYEYAMIDANPVLHSAQAHVFYLVDLYIKTNQNDKAWGYLSKVSIEYIHETHKIRMYQFRILKKEKRYTEAMIFLMEAYLLKSQFTNSFNEKGFKKDANSTINKLEWDNTKLEYLAKLIKDQVNDHNFDQELLRSKYWAFLNE